MEERLISDLGKLIVPVNSLWSVIDIVVDHLQEEIHVEVVFNQEFYKYKGKKLRLYDKRPARQWRHLDLWQFKTYIVARVPRIKTELGIMSIPVPWADEHERMTILLEKKF